MSSSTRMGSNVLTPIAGDCRFVAVALLLLAIPSAAEAVCSDPAVNFAQYYSTLISPGANTPQTLVGSFWALGFGNPSLNTGDDNGSFGDDNWIVSYSDRQIILGNWSQSNGIDGCINGKTAPGKASEIMVTEFSDYRVQSDSFFAIAAVARDPAYWVQFDFSTVGPAVTLAVLPKPVIVASVQTGPHTLMVRVAGPSASQLAAGFYSDGSVSLPEVIVGYRIYGHGGGFGAPPPDVRREEGWVPLTGTLPFGQLTNVNVECNHVYEFLAVSLVYESGYESAYVSQRSTVIECEMCYGDFDHDGFSSDPSCGLVDCDDADVHTHPGAVEINDGKDNQCPGDAGFGLVDELDGVGGFTTLADKNTISWPPQTGASAYQLARSSDPAMAAGCTSFVNATPSITDSELPPTNLALYYLIRSTAPHTGSWGATSAGAERSTTCP